MQFSPLAESPPSHARARVRSIATEIRRRGFTLIEMLVVLAVVAAVAVAVTLSLRGNQGRALQREVERTAILLQLACERALVTGTDLGTRFDSRGLRFGYLRDDRWVPFGDSSSDELRPRDMPDNLQIAAFTDGVQVDPEREPERPHWVCFASGEAIPVRLEIAGAGTPEKWLIEVGADAQVTTRRDDDPRG